MLYYNTIDLGERIDPAKNNNSKEYIVCHGFRFQKSVSNGCHDLTMLYLNLNDIARIIIEGVDYCCIVHDISKS